MVECRALDVLHHDEVDLRVGSIVVHRDDAMLLGVVGSMMGMPGFEALGLVAGSVGAVVVQRFTRVPYN